MEAEIIYDCMDGRMDKLIDMDGLMDGWKGIYLKNKIKNYFKNIKFQVHARCRRNWWRYVHGQAEQRRRIVRRQQQTTCGKFYLSYSLFGLSPFGAAG